MATKYNMFWPFSISPIPDYRRFSGTTYLHLLSQSAMHTHMHMRMCTWSMHMGTSPCTMPPASTEHGRLQRNKACMR
eukprot:365061-Chlamydomonas_euryale.AAC.6